MKTYLTFLVSIFFILSCNEEDQVTLPKVITSSIEKITYNSAIGGGEITSDGGTTITECGICWNTLGNPTISDNKTNDSSGIGSYVSNISELSEFTSYYVRAYAINSVGISYGEERYFKTTYIPLPFPHKVSVIPRTVIVGQSVQFADNTEYPIIYPDSWLWEFGDGDTSNLQNPLHAYTKAGVYSVTLTTKHYGEWYIGNIPDCVTVTEN